MAFNAGEIEQEAYGLSFDVAKSMRYHAYRRGFFDACDKITKVLIIGVGGATFVSLSNQDTFWAKFMALSVAFLSALDIVIGFHDHARIHDKLYNDFSILGQEIADNVIPTEQHIAKWLQRRLAIEMEEPGTMDWLERRCSGEEAKARGAEVNPAWILPQWKLVFSQIVSLPGVIRPGVANIPPISG